MSDLKRLMQRFLGGPEEPEPPPPAPHRAAFDWEPSTLIGEVGKAAEPSLPAPAAVIPPQGDTQIMPAITTSPVPAAWKKPPSWARPEPPPPAPAAPAANLPADVEDFSAVYAQGGIAPPEHGYGADRINRMLESRRLGAVDRSVRASAVLAALDAAGVGVGDAIDEAVLRARALTAFEAAKTLEVEALRSRHGRRIQQLKEEIDAFVAEKKADLRTIEQETTAAAEELAAVRRRKREEEDHLHQVATQFVEPLPPRVLPMPQGRPEDPFLKQGEGDAGPAEEAEPRRRKRPEDPLDRVAHLVEPERVVAALVEPIVKPAPASPATLPAPVSGPAPAPATVPPAPAAAAPEAAAPAASPGPVPDATGTPAAPEPPKPTEDKP